MCGLTLLVASTAPVAHAQLPPPTPAPLPDQPPPPPPPDQPPPPPAPAAPPAAPPPVTYQPSPPPPPAASEPGPRVRRTRGFAGNTFVGFHDYLGDFGAGLDRGFRIGTALGGRFGRVFGLTGELATDFFNRADFGDGLDYAGIGGQMSLVGTFYIPIGIGELRIAGKLGAVVAYESYSDGNSTATAEHAGIVEGLNAGVGFFVGPRLQLGPMLMIEHQSIVQSCFDAGFGWDCSSEEAATPSGTVVSLLFGLWY